MREPVACKLTRRIALAVVTVSLVYGCVADDDRAAPPNREDQDDQDGGVVDHGSADDRSPAANGEADSANGSDDDATSNADDKTRDDEHAASPLYEDAVVDPDWMLIEPDIVAPGGTVNVFFPQETERSVHFALERHTDDGWDHVFDLGSGEGIKGGTMGWDPVDGEHHEYPSVAVHGPGPEVLPIPEPAVPGEYRICKRLGDDAVCAELTIED